MKYLKCALAKVMNRSYFAELNKTVERASKDH